MEYIGSLISACFQILSMNIDLFGYQISLYNVLVFVIVAGLLWRLVWSFLR